MLQYELSQVLYPVFLHCCLKLVASEAGSEATQLIGRYSQRFTTIGGQPSKVRMQVRFKTAALCRFPKSFWLKTGSVLNTNAEDAVWSLTVMRG